MECYSSASADLTGKIACCIRIGKVPPNNTAIGTAPELTTLWWNAVPRVKFVYRVQLIYETASWYADIYKVWEISPPQPSGLVCLRNGSFASNSIRFAMRRPLQRRVSPQIDGTVLSEHSKPLFEWSVASCVLAPRRLLQS